MKARHLWLVGMMGSGKSSAGRAAAARLKWRFVDVDEVVEKNEGRTIAEIFRERGEPAFRRAEAKAVARAAKARAPSVIATGGGAVLDPENVRAMRGSGRVVWMRATPAELSRRLNADGSRPLLAKANTSRDRERRLADILKLRESSYQLASHTSVGAGRLSIPEAAARIVLQARALRSEGAVTVRTPAGRYDVEIGAGILDRAGAIVRAAAGGSKAFLLADESVVGTHAPRLAASLQAAGYSVALLPLAAGEKNKTLAQVQRVWRFLFSHGVERSSPVVCLGGGVVGDLGGFAAATSLRGVPVVQVPTTLVAQVDSSVGGKTGIDIAAGKNLVGAFHWPTAVIVDIDLLATLPERELRAGLGEVLKYGLIADPSLFAAIENGGAAVLADAERLAWIVRRSIEIKAAIVARDPEEKGVRAVLNAGHTIGHAMEAASRFRMLHGEAVASGLAAEARFAEAVGMLPASERARIEAAVEAIGGDARPALRGAVPFLGSDKKRRGDHIRMPLLTRIGRARLIDVEMTRLADFCSEK